MERHLSSSQTFNQNLLLTWLSLFPLLAFHKIRIIQRIRHVFVSHLSFTLICNQTYLPLVGDISHRWYFELMYRALEFLGHIHFNFHSHSDQTKTCFSLPPHTSCHHITQKKNMNLRKFWLVYPKSKASKWQE